MDFIVTDDILKLFESERKITASVVKKHIPNYKDYAKLLTYERSVYQPEVTDKLENVLTNRVKRTKGDFIKCILDALDGIKDDIVIDLSIYDECYIELYTVEPFTELENDALVLNRLATDIRTKRKELSDKKVDIKQFIKSKALTNDDIETMIENLKGMLK